MGTIEFIDKDRFIQSLYANGFEVKCSMDLIKEVIDKQDVLIMSNMEITVYQVHEYQGEFEDATDVIVASYIDYEVAKKKMEDLKCKEKVRRMLFEKCKNCILMDDEKAYLDPQNKHYCEHMHIAETKWGPYCENEVNDSNQIRYQIIPVQVIV